MHTIAIVVSHVQLQLLSQQPIVCLYVCVCVWSYAFAEDVSLSPSIGSLLCVVAAAADDGGGGIVGCVSVSVSYRLINNLVFILSGALAAAMVTCLSHFTAFSIFRITCPTIFCTIYRYIHIYILHILYVCRLVVVAKGRIN